MPPAVSTAYLRRTHRELDLMFVAQSSQERLPAQTDPVAVRAGRQQPRSTDPSTSTRGSPRHTRRTQWTRPPQQPQAGPSTAALDGTRDRDVGSENTRTNAVEVVLQRSSVNRPAHPPPRHSHRRMYAPAAPVTCMSHRTCTVSGRREARGSRSLQPSADRSRPISPACLRSLLARQSSHEQPPPGCARCRDGSRLRTLDLPTALSGSLALRWHSTPRRSGPSTTVRVSSSGVRSRGPRGRRPRRPWRVAAGADPVAAGTAADLPGQDT